MEDGTRRVVDVDCDEDDEEESESNDGRFTGGRATLREDEVVEEVFGTDSTVVDVGKLLPFSELAESMPMCSYVRFRNGWPIQIRVFITTTYLAISRVS